MKRIDWKAILIGWMIDAGGQICSQELIKTYLLVRYYLRFGLPMDNTHNQSGLIWLRHYMYVSPIYHAGILALEVTFTLLGASYAARRAAKYPVQNAVAVGVMTIVTFILFNIRRLRLLLRPLYIFELLIVIPLALIAGYWSSAAERRRNSLDSQAKTRDKSDLDKEGIDTLIPSP